MYSFDSETKVLSSYQLQPFYNHFVTAGQHALHYLLRDPSKVIQISYDDGVTLTAGEMAKLGLRIAKNVSKEGLKLGDVIGLVAKNTTYVAPVVLGSLILGTPCSTLDPTFDEGEIAHIFKQTNPKIVFCDHDNMKNVEKALQSINNGSEVITIDQRVQGVRFVTEMFELLQGEAEYVPRNFGTEAYKACGVILCSSGTTSISKGTMLSHSQCIIIASAWSQIHYPTIFCFSSLYWLSGFTTLMQCLANNVKRIITKRPYRPLLLIHLVEQFRVNVIVTAPSHVALLLQSPYLKFADFSSIRVWIMGGGAANTLIRKGLQDHILYGTIVMTYGMTEVGPIISSTGPFETISNSSGKLSPNFKVKIIDEDGFALDLYEVGEIYLMPPYRFLGYANNDEGTRNAFDPEGWLKTGDLGYLTEEGEIFIVDRKKDMIKYLNYQVAPSEIEAFVNGINGVSVACIVGIPDMISGDLPAAVVIKDNNSDITEQDIIDEVARNFPIFKRLHGGAYFVDSLPMTPSGKIKKRLVRKMAAQMYKSQEINGNY
ncbi:unnamed protein product [Chironomus riparius]|uniref:Luciferin 4-monooxygenase n=1 Tax=Chironomus riparius TaxID=315576 RepID=A0A9N9RK83_9DIPT|nr:unnamed protein product [Chironomus riparius]